MIRSARECETGSPVEFEIVTVVSLSATKITEITRFTTQYFNGVPRGSVVKCLTRSPTVLSSTRNGSFGFFRGVSLGKTLQSPSLVQVKPRQDMNDVSYRRDMN